jgi:hypothetical protein
VVQIPSVQEKMAIEASERLSAGLNVPVKVGKVNVSWLNRLVLGDVTMDDRTGNLLFRADHISAGFKILPLFQHKWVITNVRLFGFDLNLSKKTPSDTLNLQFVIDAFSSSDTTKQSVIDLKINTIEIRNGNINYDVTQMPIHLNKFNPHHISIQNLNGSFAVKALQKDSINLNIRKLRLEEDSGFTLDQLSLNVTGNRDSLYITNADIRLPNTQLQLDNTSISYNEVDSLSQFVDKAPLSMQIVNSKISPRDFSAFIPALQRFPEIIRLSAQITGTINDLSLDELAMQQNGTLSVNGKMSVKGLTNPEEVYLLGNIHIHLTSSGLETIAAGLQENQVALPRPVAQLGNLDFTGEISGFMDYLVAYGKLTSDIGSLNMDMSLGHNKKENIAFFMNGRLASSELIVNQLFEEGNPFGSVRFDMDLDASRPVNGRFSGEVIADIQDFDYKKYRYDHIIVAGNFKEDEFNGSIEIDDPNGKLSANGLFKNNAENSVFNFAASLSEFKPDKLFLTDKYKNPNISFTIGANFTGNAIDNFEGQIDIDNLLFYTQPDSFTIKSFQLKTEGNTESRTLSVHSDLLNGEVTGAYSFSTLLSSFLNTGKRYLPSLTNVLQEDNQLMDNVFSLHLTVENTEALSKTLKLPVTVLKQGEIAGQYDNHSNQFSLSVMLPKINIGAAKLESFNIVCDNNQDRIKLQTDLVHLHKNGSHNQLSLKADAFDDRIDAMLSLANNRNKGIDVNISTSTLFIAENESDTEQKLRTEITLNPSDIIINDSIWKLEPASITIFDGNTYVDNFYFSKDFQYLKINGVISSINKKETLQIELNDLELSYIFDVVNVNALKFGGKATGVVHVTDVFGSRIINTDLEVENFAFNQVVQGKLKLFSEWDNQEEGILMLGTVYKTDSIYTDVNGYIYPIGEKQGLSLIFEADDVDLALLYPYFKAFSNKIEGRGYGTLHLGGSFSDLTFDGKVYVSEGKIGVNFLNTEYTFSDSIYIYPELIQAKNLIVKDKDGNEGTVSFDVTHHFLEDFAYNVNVSTRNMLIYDTSERINPQIYGTVYGDGSAQIEGTEKFVNIQANVRSNPKSSIGFNFMNNNAVDSYDFIVFKNQSSDNVKSIDSLTVSPSVQTSNEGTEYRINCMVEATPDANIELMMDPVSGDKIKANGSGNIMVEYGSKTDLAVHGAYTFQSGTYNFSLQQLIYKEFLLSDGSRVDFSGNPMEANLNINAVYFLTADVEDLDQSLAQEAVRTSVPVNCILNLTGRLQSPDISFDMKFPNSSTELERQVKSVINTDEMMMRQIIYLLVLNRFYTPDYSEGANSNEFSRVASSALSAQLSYLLNSLTDKVQIGTNIRSRQDGVTDTEVEMLLSSQLLDNRLLFNGNFGYKNNYINTNAFIGEFDLEYKLTPSGEIRLKAYNHANEMYRYTRKAQTRQGVGLMFNKDFNSFAEILRNRKIRRPTVTP